MPRSSTAGSFLPKHFECNVVQLNAGRVERNVDPVVVFITVSVIVAVVATAASAQSPTTLTDVLARSARYVADYQERLSSVVAEERYEQRVESRSGGSFDPFGGPSTSRTYRSRRRLVSDYLLVKTPGWMGPIGCR